MLSLSLSLPLSEPEREDEELLLVDDDDEDDDEDDKEDEDDETATDPPLVDFLTALGDPPGVGGIDLSESSQTLMTSKLSWLSVLDVFTAGPLELLDRGRGWGLVFGFCAGAEDDPAILPFRICSRRSGRAVPLVPQISEPGEVAAPLPFVVF